MYLQNAHIWAHRGPNCITHSVLSTNPFTLVHMSNELDSEIRHIYKLINLMDVITASIYNVTLLYIYIVSYSYTWYYYLTYPSIDFITTTKEKKSIYTCTNSCSVRLFSFIHSIQFYMSLLLSSIIARCFFFNFDI